MHAIIETGGKQYRVQKGSTVQIEKLPVAAEDKHLVFDKILAYGDQIGTPYLTGIKVHAERLGDGRGEKIRIFKYKRRKKYRKTQGHRQHFTEIKITDIIG